MSLQSYNTITRYTDSKNKMTQITDHIDRLEWKTLIVITTPFQTHPRRRAELEQRTARAALNAGNRAGGSGWTFDQTRVQWRRQGAGCAAQVAVGHVVMGEDKRHLCCDPS
jgi:hypothetical protein